MKTTLHNLSNFAKSLFYTSFIKSYIRLFGKEDSRNLKHRISLCLIFKNEAPFLKEWIDYHRTIGIDHFYLYNNDSSDNFKDVLKPYIDNKLVTLIDFPGSQVQMNAYKHCFETFKIETNWIGFFDADEFICPRYDTDINKWLKKYAKYPSVLIYNQVFGTGGKLKHDYTKNVVEQYHNCWEELQNFGKCFVNTRFQISNYDTSFLNHSTSTTYSILRIKFSLPPINQFGDICPATYVLGGSRGKKKKADIFLNHYFSKSWDIYSKKIKQADAFFKENPRKNYEYFFFHEEKCISCDYTISRFLIKMKLLQNIIN